MSLEPIRIQVPNRTISPSELLKMNSWNYYMPVIIAARIAGSSQVVRNVPQKIYVINGRQETINEIDLSDIRNVSYLRNYLFKRKQLEKLLKDEARLNNEPTPITIEYSRERMSLLPLLLRDVHPSRSGERYMYYDLYAYLVNKPLPNFSRGLFTGYMIDDNRDIVTVLIYDYEPIQEDFEEFEVSPDLEKQFKHYFQSNENLIEDIDRTIQPFVVGRKTEKYITAITLHSPLWLRFKGEIIRGTMHTLFLGDSTTGKSKILNWIVDELQIGEFGVGESGRRTGFLFTIDNERGIIVWGLLVQADRTLALIDGLQRLSSEEMSEFREALRTKKVVVRMRVSGEAPARCRIIAAANPSKPLDEYVELAEAIRDTKSFADPVDITRWDFIVRFWNRDVDSEKIAKTYAHEPKIPLDVMRKHIMWAWKLKASDIVFTKEAEKKIEEVFIELSKNMISEVPIINKGFMETLARISSSLAILHHNVNDKGKVVVEEKHVNEALSLVEYVLDKWEFWDYVEKIRSLNELTDEEYKIFLDEFKQNPMLKRAFILIAENQGIRATEIRERLEIPKDEADKLLVRLKSVSLVRSKSPSSGYRLTKKGVLFYRKLSEEAEEILSAPSSSDEGQVSEKTIETLLAMLPAADSEQSNGKK